MEDRELARMRGEIDRIDGQLLALFLERMRVAGEIGAQKGRHGIAVYDGQREAEILSRVREQAGQEHADEAETLFKTLMAISRARQERERGDT